MTDEGKFTPEEYLKYLEMDDISRHILVEGRDDKRIFELLLRELCHTDEKSRILVDSAAAFVECHPENRETVEDICDKITGETYSDRLVAFVDREFREFDFPKLLDHLNGHKVSGQLVWSRGHSIENYFFDFDTLCDPFIAFSPEGFDEALDIFKDVFDSAMRVACAISLAAREIGRLKRVRASINAQMLNVDGSETELNFDAWKMNLEGKLSPDEVERLFTRFEFWYNKVLEADHNIARWMCDGHIGFRFIWTVYDRCVQLSGQKGTLEAKPPIRFNVCANSWVKHLLDNQCEYPAAVLDLLSIGI